MFEASVDGQSYDAERWGQYYRPAGVNAPAGTSAPAAIAEDAPVAKAAPAPVASSFDEEDDVPVASAPVSTAAPAATSDKAQDILAMIRARQKA